MNKKINEMVNGYTEKLEYVIDTYSKWQEYRDSVKNPWGQFYISELTISGENMAGVVAVPAGLLGEYVEKLKYPASVIIADGLTDTVEDFFYGYLNVTIKETDFLYRLAKAGCRIFRIISENGEGFFLKEGAELSCLTGEEEKYEAKYFMDVRFRKSRKYFEKVGITVIEYTPIGGWSTAGQLKAGTHVFAARNLPGFRPWAIFNRLTHGMARLQRRWPEPEFPKEQAKLAIRQSQGIAPMVKLPKLGGMAVLLEKRGGETGECDGLAYVKANYVARAYSTDKVKVLPEAVVGDGCQCRPCIMTKTFGLVVTREFMEELLWGEGKYRIHFVYLDEVDKQTQKDFESAVFNGPLNARGGKGAALVIVPSRRDENGELIKPVDLVRSVDYVTDLNGLKAPFDLKMGLTGLNPLGWSHAHLSVEEMAKTSTQLLAKMSLKDPNGTKRFMETKAEEMFRQGINEVLEMKNQPLTLAELNGDPANILNKTAAKFVKEIYQPAFRSAIDQKITGWSNGLRHLNVKIDGLYNKIVPDLGAQVAGVKLLGVFLEHIEIYAPGLEKAGIEEVVAIRYPSQGNEEYTICKVVGREEMKERATWYRQNGYITEWQFRNLCRMVSTLRGGITAIPLDNNILGLFGGADFDGDGIVLVSEKGVVEILKKGYETTATII